MYVIPILVETIELIQVLNGGVRPEIHKNEPTFLVGGPGRPTEIYTHDSINNLEESWYTTTILTSE